MGVDFSEEMSPDSLGEFVEQFNALPDERRAEMMGAPNVDPVVIGPVVMPCAEDVIASAQAAPVLAGFLA